MKHYYYNNFRGFSNTDEYISVNLNDENEVKLLEEMEASYYNSNNTNWSFHRITRKEAFKAVADNRATKRFYKKVGLNDTVGSTKIETITEHFAY